MALDVLARSKSQRTDDILCAAEHVFARDGFAAATMDAVAREAGVSKGGMYRHFSSKDELFLAVVARTAKELDALLRSDAAVTTAVNGFAALRACIALTMSFAKQSDGKVKLALDCSAIRDLVDPRSPALPPFDEAVTSLVELGLDVLRRGQTDGSIRSDVHVAGLAVSLWGAVIGSLQMAQSLNDWSSRLSLRLDTGGADIVDVIASSARP